MATTAGISSSVVSLDTLKVSIAHSPITSLHHQSIRRRARRHRPIRGIRSNFDDEKMDEEPSVSDLKSALGISREDETLRSRFSPFQSNGSNGNVKKENKFMDSIEKASEGLSDITEGDEYQIGALQLVLSLFPIWVLYVLVAADFVHLPFPLPFME